VPIWARTITALAIGRVAVGLTLPLSDRVDSLDSSPMPVWVYALLSASFALVGGALAIGNKRDARAEWLGGILALLAVPLSERLLSRDFAELARLRPDIFLPAFLWHFVKVFPSKLGGRFGFTAGIVARIAAVFSAIVFVLMLSLLLWPLPEDPDWRAGLMPVSRGGSLYWLITFSASLAAVVALMSRSIGSAGSDRFRLRVFAAGLFGGLAPLFVEVMVEEAWPAYKELVHQPSIEPFVAALLFVPMAAVPFVVAYSVLYDRVVETRVILRLAAQYLLAKATIIAISIVPFVALTMFLYERRTESLATLLGGPRPVLLGLTVAAGSLVLRLRRRWLQALDRRYFRESHDASTLISRLVASDWISETPQAIAAALCGELGTAFHARVDLFVVDPVTAELRNARDGSGGLPAHSTLAALVSANPQPMSVEVAGDSALARLPQADRAWLEAGQYALLVPLRVNAAELIGILALTGKQSELSYSDPERRELMAIVTPVALALENNRLRSGADSQTPPAAGECQSCSRVQEGGADSCACGGRIAEAAVPYLLRGVFRFERRLGAGGMGVVYLARDLTLGRHVAIKTLPQLASRHRGRLHAEAQAMASMVDGNLAVIYGIESWRGVPFLVEEYLEGGTLSWRLLRGPMAIDEAIDLGITLAGALGRLHDAGIIHCDVKPSNIGFTGNGVPKLIDFGLATIIGAAGVDTLTARAATGHAPTGLDDALSTAVTRHGVVGTPAYMCPEALTANAPARGFDVWALSVVLFEAIAGQRPFQGKGFAEVSISLFGGTAPEIRATRSDCGENVSAFFAHALSRDPGQRPRDARALQQQLLALRGARV
jgi:hypothetical protein